MKSGKAIVYIVPGKTQNDDFDEIFHRDSLHLDEVNRLLLPI